MSPLLNQVVQGAPNEVKLSGFTTIYSFMSVIINVVIGGVFSLACITLAYGFVQFAMSKGDPKDSEKARFAVEWSLVAMLIALLSVALKIAFFKAAGVTGALNSNNPGI